MYYYLLYSRVSQPLFREESRNKWIKILKHREKFQISLEEKREFLSGK
jgi:hypothetical protein